MPKDKFPNEIYVKREHDGVDSWLNAFEDDAKLLASIGDEPETVVVYKMVSQGVASKSLTIEMLHKERR